MKQVTTTTVEVALDPEAAALLSKLYGLIWTEACYDPSTEGSEKFARECLPLIKRLNEMWRFKP